jgi:predicted AlkP superfamily pyrophosphatase or phosphodiesterase
MLDVAPAPDMAPALDPIYWESIAHGARHIVLVLLDALGYLQLQQMLEQEPDSIWGRWAAQGLLLPMTSVFPSTTATSLATLMTGAEPIAHGYLGYQVWLREYGILTQMLALKPALIDGQETLMDWGLVPEKMLPVSSLGDVLEAGGVATTALVPSQYTRGALTRISYRGFGKMLGYADPEGMWTMLGQTLQHHRSERSVSFAYWGGIDSAAHAYGSGGGIWQAQYHTITTTCEQYFASRLTREMRKDTLLIMCADHGFVDSPVETAHDTDTDPVFQRELLIPFSGEARAAYLHCMAGQDRAVEASFRETLGENYTVLPSQDAVAAGLFGAGAPWSESLMRLGHYCVIPHGLHYLDRQERRHVLRGRHGGLRAEEMLVPCLAVRLDA